MAQVMPAEWTRHAATWIAWPHNESDWPGKFAPIRWVYGEFVRLLAAHERVRILVANDAVEAEVKETLALVGAPANWDRANIRTSALMKPILSLLAFSAISMAPLFGDEHAHTIRAESERLRLDIEKFPGHQRRTDQENEGKRNLKDSERVPSGAHLRRPVRRGRR